MRTNPGANINTNWQINGIVKPAHVNALTKAIKYDYVVPADKVVRKDESTDEPDDLYVLCDSPAQVDDDVSIFINSSLGISGVQTDAQQHTWLIGPLFKLNASNFVTQGHVVHVYALCSNALYGGYGLRASGNTGTSIALHTHGEHGRVWFLEGSTRPIEATFYVGSGNNMDNLDNSSGRGGLIYEMSVDGKLPSAGSVTQRPWMSNALASNEEPDIFIDIPADFSLDNPGTMYNEGQEGQEKYNKVHEILGLGYLPVCRARLAGPSGTHGAFAPLIWIDNNCCLYFCFKRFWPETWDDTNTMTDVVYVLNPSGSWRKKAY